jgi:hypothetical protein
MRIPPALAAQATPRILELLGDPPGLGLELGFAGIHAVPLRLVGFEVVVVDPSPSARERAGDVLLEPPARAFDFVIAPEGTDVRGIDAKRRIVVRADGSVVG